MKHLPPTIGDLLDGRDESEARIARNWQRITERRRQRRGPRAGIVWLTAATAIAVVLGFWLWPRSSSPLHTRDGVPLESALETTFEQPTTIDLDDGSSLIVAAGTKLSTLESSAARVALALRHGRVRLSVVHESGRRWSVEAGLATIEVTGTIFEVARDGEVVTVRVERGRVIVRSPTLSDGSQRLDSGDTLTLELPDRPPPAEPVAEASEGALSRGRAARGPSRVPTPEPSAAELLDAADTARRAGDLDRAMALLTTASRRVNDKDASVASLTRGRLALQLRRDDEAVRDLRYALALGLPTPLVELARARLVEALAKSGKTEEARRAAREYLDEYPGGAWAAVVQRWAELP